MKWLSADEIGVYLEIASAILAFLVAAYHLIRDHRTKTTTDPMTILARAAGLAILPQSLIIMFWNIQPVPALYGPGIEGLFHAQRPLVTLCLLQERNLLKPDSPPAVR